VQKSHSIKLKEKLKQMHTWQAARLNYHNIFSVKKNPSYSEETLRTKILKKIAFSSPTVLYTSNGYAKRNDGVGGRVCSPTDVTSYEREVYKR